METGRTNCIPRFGSRLTAADLDWTLAPVEPVKPHVALPVEPTDALDILARSEAQLLARVVELEGERDVYRTMASQALQALRDVVVERDRLRELRRQDRRAA